MELRNHPTEPKVTTAIDFSAKEVLEALKDYAIKNGYEFNKAVGQKEAVIFPYRSSKRTILQVSCDNTIEPLIKEKK